MIYIKPNILRNPPIYAFEKSIAKVACEFTKVLNERTEILTQVRSTRYPRGFFLPNHENAGSAYLSDCRSSKNVELENAINLSENWKRYFN